MIDLSNFNSLFEITEYFNSKEICKQTIAEQRWVDGVVTCPYCGCTHCYNCKDGRYTCKQCNKRFSVLVGTIFQNTKLPLKKWFMAMYLVPSHKKGISSYDLSRDIDISEK